MKTLTQSVATKLVAAPVATKTVSGHGIPPHVYGFMVSLLAGRAGEGVKAFLTRANTWHKTSGKIFPRTPLESTAVLAIKGSDAKETIAKQNQALDAWKTLVNSGKGKNVAGMTYSQSVYDIYRIVRMDYMGQ